MSDVGQVARNLSKVRAAIVSACAAVDRDAGDVQLLAVSKMHAAPAVRAAHAAGQRSFGENRVQELIGKAQELIDLAPIGWHLIGSLQTNKVRDLLQVPGLQLVHSLDRPRLADALQQELSRTQRSLDVLLQVNSTDDADKHGCRPEHAGALLNHVVQQCPRVNVRGLMAMGPLHDDAEPVFRQVAALRDELRASSGLPLPVLSLGMSHDMVCAIAAGSTLVRIGTAVFGARD